MCPAVKKGYISMYKFYPSLKLYLYCYTSKCVIEILNDFIPSTNYRIHLPYQFDVNIFQNDCHFNFDFLSTFVFR